MKLVKGKKYVINGFVDLQSKSELSKFKVKFPQEALFNGIYFVLKDKTGFAEYAVSHFNLDKVKLVNKNTLEIYPYRGGFRYRKIAANGKILNHHYNTVAAAKKGAEAEREFWENYKVVYKG